MHQDSLLSLSRYHPVVIEGMGSHDTRAPDEVAAAVARRLRSHWAKRSLNRPALIVTQGDPLEARGISAITPRVASELNMARGLVCLDEEIADYHAPNADRNNVILELRYSQLARLLNAREPGATARLETAVERDIARKNQRRHALGKGPLKDYFRDFALLQEVTKAGCRQLCGGLTVAHTASEIHEFSVTSFYTVGLALGWVEPDDMVAYPS